MTMPPILPFFFDRKIPVDELPASLHEVPQSILNWAMLSMTIARILSSKESGYHKAMASDLEEGASGDIQLIGSMFQDVADEFGDTADDRDVLIAQMRRVFDWCNDLIAD